MPNVAFYTLGCRLNQAETGLATADLAGHGYTPVPWGKPADVLVINSCAVTAAAAQKTRQAVRAARRRWPEAFIVVIGCGVTVDHDAWQTEEGPDLIVPNPPPAPLSALLPAVLRPNRQLACIAPGEPQDGFTIPGAGVFGERTRANLKIQDGCDFFCSYCIVPFTRGRSRSRAAADVLREAQTLIDYGYHELVLCGVNLTAYHDHGLDLAGLLRQLLTLNGDFRLRLGSAEPAPVLERVVDVMAEDRRICRFLHLPLQYGEDSILHSMGRHYRAADYRRLAETALARIDGLCLGADVIVGFPGETDAAFACCRDFLTSLPFGLLHVFSYSPRPGTAAAGLAGRPPARLVKRRSEELLAVGAAKAAAFATSQIGQTVTVLLEDGATGTGWSDNYLHVRVETPVRPPANTFLDVEIVAAAENREVRGRAVAPPALNKAPLCGERPCP